MQIKLPVHVSKILNILEAHNYEAYVVGGCVRDCLLGKSPADWDITTSARPEQVKALFPRTIDTGIKHGTVTIMMGKSGYEVTTYRVDGIYEDHRRPSEVTFTDSLKEDLMRRDFTINAMAYNESRGLVDLFGGADDLKRGMIRCVGDPEERFEEDALRMMRAIRFAGQLDFEIHEDTLRAIRTKRELLRNVSAERIQMELLKMMISDHPDIIRTAWEVKLTDIFLPEFNQMMITPQNNPHHRFTVGEHTLHALTCIPANPILRLAILFHDIGKPLTRSTDEEGIDHFYRHDKVSSQLTRVILKRLKFDNRTIDLVTTLILYHDTRFKDPRGNGRRQVRRMMHKVGPSLFPYLLKVMEADVRAQSTYMQEMKLDILAETEEACQEILAAEDCLSLKDLKINGNQLKDLGISEGKTIGSILNTLLSMVLEHPELNEYIYLEELALKIYARLTEENKE
ncbi:MAG: CCA tRNA nucleotidyltransferase [Eubacterium sp.]|nr:CCA tRNA nucleotidyltransferase [Eubacterium sp.]